MKYRKKPVVIEAMQFDGSGDSAREIVLWSGGAVEAHEGRLVIETLEGLMSGMKDDFIVKGIKGEFYPYKPNIFEASYQSVNEPRVASEFWIDEQSKRINSFGVEVYTAFGSNFHKDAKIHVREVLEDE